MVPFYIITGSGFGAVDTRSTNRLSDAIDCARQMVQLGLGNVTVRTWDGRVYGEDRIGLLIGRR